VGFVGICSHRVDGYDYRTGIQLATADIKTKKNSWSSRMAFKTRHLWLYTLAKLHFFFLLA
jgi:hypothetical protein